MARKNRTPEENARREKIRELLQMANIGSMDDIQNLFKETIAEFMENGLEAELDDELGYRGARARPSQTLCKPPARCRMEVSHRRYNTWPERTVVAGRARRPVGYIPAPAVISDCLPLNKLRLAAGYIQRQSRGPGVIL